MAKAETSSLTELHAQSKSDLARRSEFDGRTISHYRVEQRLGAGGMGEVYRAYDLALGRPAALKLLLDHFSPSQRARLISEAWASARLQHPAIATFFEAGEHQGVAFIAMEYVAGHTLRERLQNGPLPIDQALAIGACVLEALSHAHAAGILHRDIKPENIMLTGERAVKLLDFGLAKHLLAETPSARPPTRVAAGTPPAVPPRITELDATTEYRPNTDTQMTLPSPVDLTAMGDVVGTVGYMSPEQLLGQPMDARSDLFLVGVVLHEMISGKRAFPGKSPRERIEATLHQPLPQLSAQDIPAGLDAVLACALARDPDQRYPSAGAFLAELRRISTAAATAAIPNTLAILDFANLSGEPTDDWMGHGFADGLFDQLAGLAGLQMVPRPKVLQARAAFPGSDSEFGQQLGCRKLIAGTIQKIAAGLRVTARLFDLPTGQVVFEEQIEGTAEELVSMQGRLANLVAIYFKQDLTRQPAAVVAPSLEAYECAIRGRQLWMRFGKEGHDQAQELFERAVRLDPDCAQALSGLATVHALRFSFTTDPQTLVLAADYARRAIAANPRLAEPHVWLGYVLHLQEKLCESYQELKKGMELDPANPVAPYFAAGVFQFSLRRADALQLCEDITGRACIQDPHHWRHSEAVKLLQRSVDLNPYHGWPWLGLGMAHLELANLVEARWCLEKAVALEREGHISLAGSAGYLGECLRRSGSLDEARNNCLAGLDAVETTDHQYRDTVRGVCLCSLGRTTLQQGNLDAARAAFHQAVQHLRGRSRARGGGHLFVQALAGLAQAGEGHAPFEEAVTLFNRRDGFDFHFLWCCTDDVTLMELARAARKLGRLPQARDLLERALDVGSAEALSEQVL